MGERRNGNFIETLCQSAAGTMVVSPRVAWADPRRVQTLADQVSLENLVVLGERLSGDATALLDRAAFDGEEIASAAVRLRSLSISIEGLLRVQRRAPRSDGLRDGEVNPRRPRPSASW